ncbi:hypothetical protein Tco_1145994, partial [Tanacetum coccineum]
LDLEFLPKENKIDIRKCNGRIPRGLTPRELTFQVVLDAIALTSCYPAFLITVDVPEVEFDPLPSEEDTVSFLRELSHSGEINSLNDVVVDQMHQPWRTFAALINRSLSGKTSGLDKLLLKAQSFGYVPIVKMFIDYVELLWEDFIYQIENRVNKKQKKMYYTCFTKVIIHHFLIQEKSLFRRNKIGMHTSKDDYLINSLRFVSAKESSQIYGAVLPECLTSPEMKESKAYKTYLGYARKLKKASPSKKDSIVFKETPVKTKSTGKEKMDVSRRKDIDLLSEVDLAAKETNPPQEPTDPDWNISRTTQEGPTQKWLMTLVASTSIDKSLKDFDELMSTPIDFSLYILNGLKIENLIQEVLLGPAFRLLKGTRSNYAELEYDFEECYKALSEKHD